MIIMKDRNNISNTKMINKIRKIKKNDFFFKIFIIFYVIKFLFF